MVLDVTALWGLMKNEMKNTNNFVSSPLISHVLFWYVVRVATAHSMGFSGKEGKKNSSITFPCLDCSAKVDGRKDTPLLHNFILERSNWDKSADLDSLVIANKKTIFKVSCFSDHSTVCMPLCNSKLFEPPM